MISSQVGTAWAHSQISEQLTLNCHTLMRQHFLPFQVIRKFIERYSYLFNCSSWALLRKLYLLFLSAPIAFAIRRGTAILATWWLQWNLHSDFRNQRLYSSVVERQSCKLKVLGSISSGGFIMLVSLYTYSKHLHFGVHHRQTLLSHDCAILASLRPLATGPVA